MVTTARTEALGRTGSRHARQLAATRTRLRVRPARITPNRPPSTASHRVAFGWERALSI